jgi:para-aminobenzoate synthetase/4-amino-4-deoxychorismate lyase
MTARHSLPAEVYALVDQTPSTVLLEGGSPDRTNESQTDQKPWTRLFTAPTRACAAYGTAEIPPLFAEIESAVRASRWAAGFFSYECGAAFEPKAQMRPLPEGRPLAWFGIYERSYCFDHQSGRFIDGEPPGLDDRGNRAQASERRAAVESRISSEFALTEAEYVDRIARIEEWIRSGDVYQLNFTAPWRVRTEGGAAEIYAELRRRQPVEYGAFIHWLEGRRILSFSPELFFRVEEEAGGRRITTRPMKGTAPRGRTLSEDRAQSEWLSQDAKNRSENVMIVDLLRNDLGRIARFGTVRAEELFALERLPTLWQMTSTVTALLRDQVGFHDIFRALFPCGSITGAPKVRAMQLIAEIEDQPRGVYTGAIGFFSPRRTVFNVAIRTLEMEDGQGTMGAGSGIVIDSKAAEEYRECLLKARFLTARRDEFPAEFSLVETLRWEDGFPLIELHLDRLEASAGFFGFACDRAKVRSELEQAGRIFAAGSAWKVRLLMDREGITTLRPEKLDYQALNLRACVSPLKTDPEDAMLFHKTTHRSLYAEEFKEAAAADFCDVLFFNLRGELTEGAISNIFVERSGRLLTPPVRCGLLPGVCRRHLIETRCDIEERVLNENDLCSADAVYLANAVRGLRRVEIDWQTE